MLTNILHRVARHPWVYDQIQCLAGSRRVQQHLARQIMPFYSAPLVLDIGGGTGMVRDLFSPGSTYVCLDIDPMKLSGFVNKYPGESVLLANAAQLPIQSRSVDLALCTNVSHHLPDALLDKVMAETMRVLGTRGRFIFLDAVWNPSRPISRLLWTYDRGASPRREQQLRDVVARHGTIIYSEVFSVFHSYTLYALESNA